MPDLAPSTRLRALKATELLDSPAEEAFDRLTRIAARLVGAPIALVSLVDERRQFFKSAFGLEEPLQSERETPLSHSFCKYVTDDGAPFVVHDAREDARVRDHLAVRELDVQAYLGVPIVVANEAIGSFCVVDVQPHAWTPHDLALMNDLAQSIVSEIELRAALRATHQQKLLTDTLLEAIGDGIVATDTSARVLVVNGAAQSLFGGNEDDRLRVGETLPSRWTTDFQSMHTDGSPMAPDDGALRRGLAGKPTDGLVFSVEPFAPDVDARRTATWIEASGRPVRDDTDRVIASIAVYRDVTEKRAVEQALRRSEQVYRAIVHHLPGGGVLMVDRDMRYVAADGPAIEAILRRNNLPGIVGRLVADVSSPENQEHVLACYQRCFEGEPCRLEVSFRERTYELNAVPIFAGDYVSHALVFLYDITERTSQLADLRRLHQLLEERSRELEEASVTDELTRLLNRRGFLLLAEQEMKKASRNQSRLVLCFVDLNGMKKINDTLGHEVGDQALIDTAQLLRKCFRDSDVIARLGGDEFVVLANDAPVTSGPTFEARLMAALDEYNELGGPFRLSMSLGTAIFDPSQPLDLETLLTDADARMYEQKRTAAERRTS